LALISSAFTSSRHRDPHSFPTRRSSDLAYEDHELQWLLDALERRGLLDNTIVIVTSDHGEEFGEHDVFTHGNTLYDPALRVPLRSEEHTSELQSRENLVCRLLLEKKKK